MTKRKEYYSQFYRDGTEDVISIYTPRGREMLSVGFWWEGWTDQDGTIVNFGTKDQRQRFADAELIVAALNAYKPKRSKATAA
jgi:hypothetical protein